MFDDIFKRWYQRENKQASTGEGCVKAWHNSCAILSPILVKNFTIGSWEKHDIYKLDNTLKVEQTAAEDDERYPPSKVLPFYGFSFFVAPICFLFSDPVVLYAFFRKMYLRYFIRLHSIAEAPFHDPGMVIKYIMIFFENKMYFTHEKPTNITNILREIPILSMICRLRQKLQNWRAQTTGE